MIPVPSPIPSRSKLDAVFEGGGVRGIGLVGAIAVVEETGYAFENVAGTSAGAIVAALVAAGYSAAELKTAIESIDFRRITDTNVLGKIPFVGALANILGQFGIYQGDYFLGLIRELLAAKGKRTFADVIMPAYAADTQYRYKVQVVASDITRGRMLVLPGDVRDYGLVPDALEIALAVRMSMSIPLFFRPVRLRSTRPGEGVSLIVDGGLLSDFPVELMDTQGTPDWPTFGFRLVESATPSVERYPVQGPISYLKAIMGTAMSAHDARYVATHNFVRSILIPTLGVSSTNFALDTVTRDALYQSGRAGATEFLAHWNFEEYKATFRSGSPEPRRRDLTNPTVPVVPPTPVV